MQFYNKNGHPQTISVTHNGQQIVECTKTKFLGFNIDSQLNWKEHISFVCQKLNRFTYALYRLTTLSNQKTALTAYHGYVCSTLRYGLVLWGNCVDVGRAFVIQKKCVRAMCGVGQRDSCRSLFKQLNILTLPSMYIYEVCVLTKNNLQLFKKNSDVCAFATRYPKRLIAPTCSTTTYRRSCYLMSVKLYNKLPDSLRDLSPKKFKTELYL